MWAASNILHDSMLATTLKHPYMIHSNVKIACQSHVNGRFQDQVVDRFCPKSVDNINRIGVQQEASNLM